MRNNGTDINHPHPPRRDDDLGRLARTAAELADLLDARRASVARRR